MHNSSVLVFALSLLVPFVTADLHYSGICVNKQGGQSVYDDGATRAACAAYLARNTGSKQWDTCPDCAIIEVGGLTHCHSEARHIGGDELNYYCKQNGAGGSLAD